MSNIIIFNFPPGAAGKFITLCLALSDKVLHQSKRFAEIKLAGKSTEQLSFTMSKSVLSATLKEKKHYELGLNDLANFDDEDNIHLASPFFNALHNQDRYFVIHSHRTSDPYPMFPDAHIIQLENYEYILNKRLHVKWNKRYPVNYSRDKPVPRGYQFNQKALLLREDFVNEMNLLCDHLQIDHVNPEYLDELRLLFWDTYLM